VIQQFTGDGLPVLILSNRSDLNPQVLSEKVADLALNLDRPEQKTSSR